jgi:hypothetical protein
MDGAIILVKVKELLTECANQKFVNHNEFTFCHSNAEKTFARHLLEYIKELEKH